LGNDGPCGQWANLFRACIALHGIPSVTVAIVPKPELNLNGFYIKTEIQAQGGAAGKFDFQNHAVVKLTDDPFEIIYDPSYGKTYPDLMTWENQSVDRFFAVEEGIRVDYDNIQNVPQTKEHEFEEPPIID